jgi:hypothetical protein
MRLVVEFVVGDGCTYSSTVTRPVEYSSAEAFLVEFEEACRIADSDPTTWYFQFAQYDWEPVVFFEGGEFCPPDVMTIDEWFDNVVC